MRQSQNLQMYANSGRPHSWAYPKGAQVPLHVEERILYRKGTHLYQKIA